MEIRHAALCAVIAAATGVAGWFAGALSASSSAQMDCAASNWINQAGALTSNEGKPRPPEEVRDLVNASTTVLTLLIAQNYESISSPALRDEVRQLARRIIEEPGVLHDSTFGINRRGDALKALECIANGSPSAPREVSECSRAALRPGA